MISAISSRFSINSYSNNASSPSKTGIHFGNAQVDTFSGFTEQYENLRKALLEEPLVPWKANAIDTLMGLPVSDEDKFTILLAIIHRGNKLPEDNPKVQSFKSSKRDWAVLSKAVTGALASLTGIPIKQRLGVIKPFFKTSDDPNRESFVIAGLHGIASLPDFDDQANPLRKELCVEGMNDSNIYVQAAAVTAFMALNLPKKEVIQTLAPVLTTTTNQNVIRAFGNGLVSRDDIPLADKLTMLLLAAGSEQANQNHRTIGTVAEMMEALNKKHRPELEAYAQGEPDTTIRGETVPPRKKLI